MRAPSTAGSRSRIRSVPSLTGETHPIIRIVELLPAPLGPRKPNASPRLTSRSIPSTATRSPKRLTRPRAWIMEPFSLKAPTYLPRSDGLPRRLDVARDLVDQLLLALEDLLVAQPLPELHHEPTPVEVAIEVEQVGLDPPLLAAVVRVRADRDRGAPDLPVVEPGGAGVDPVRRHDQARLHREVRGRIAERPASLVAADDDAVELGWTTEQLRRPRDLARVQAPPDLRRRDALEQRHRHHRVAEAREHVEVASTLVAEAEVCPCDDDRRIAELARRELLRLQPRHVERELDHPRLGHAQLREQLQPALERREPFDEVAEHDPRVRLERDHPHGQPRLQRRLDHPPVAQVDAVERAEGDREAPPGGAHDSSASAASAGITRSSSASSTLKGPTSSRRSETQCPPSASAIARTYVPELTRRSSVATLSL